MEICLPQPVTLDNAKVLDPLLRAVESVRRPLIEQNWHAICGDIKAHHLDAIREDVKVAITLANSSISTYLDETWQEVRTAKKIIPDFVERCSEHMAEATAYLYWNYSGDVLGRGVGISRSALERQFGMMYMHDGFLAPKVVFQCPCCGDDGTLNLSDIGSGKPFFYTFACNKCVHTEQTDRMKGLQNGRLDCSCPSCVEYISHIAKNILPAASRIGLDLASYLKTQTQQQIDHHVQMGWHGHNEPVPADVVRFAKAVLNEPAGFLGDILDKSYSSPDDIRKGKYFPYAMYTRWSRQLAELSKWGVVEFGVTEDIDVMEPQQILDASIIARGKNTAEENERSVINARAITTLLMGYKEGDKESFKAWVTAVTSDLGLMKYWFPLPVEFCWRTVDERIREVAGQGALGQADEKDPFVRMQLAQCISFAISNAFQSHPENARVRAATAEAVKNIEANFRIKKLGDV